MSFPGLTRSRSLATAAVAVTIAVIGLVPVLCAHPEPEPGLSATQVARKSPVRDTVVDSMDSHHGENRVLGNSFPDGRIWVRAIGDGERINSLAFSWMSGEERCFPAPLPRLADDDGWWKLEEDGPAQGRNQLAVWARGYCVAWIARPSRDVTHEVLLAKSRQCIDLTDVVTGRPVSGARIMISRSPIGECMDVDDVLPGSNEANAVYLALEGGPGRYNLNGTASNGEYYYSLAHEFYLKDKSSPSRLRLGPYGATMHAQMPTVASVRYVGDEVLDGTISYPGKLVQDPETIAALRTRRSHLAEIHKGALTVLFLGDHGAADGESKAVATCILRHGARRVDQIPVFRLDEFTGPFELQAPAGGEEIQLQSVTIKEPPKFGDVVPNFKVIINGGKKWPIKVVGLGDTVDLPPGDYLVSGRGDWAMGALARHRFTVRAGEPTTMELKWREGIRMYIVQVEASVMVSMIQVESGEGSKLFVVNAPVNEKGVAVFWIGSDIAKGIVHVKDCRSSPVMFEPTADPRIRRGECRLIAERGN